MEGLLIVRFIGWFVSRLILLTDRVRDYFIEHRRFGIALIVALVIVFGYFNWIAERGGILEDPILNKEDIYYQSNRYVEENTEFADSFKVGIKCPDGITMDVLERLIYWTDALREEFGDSVISLSAGIPDTRVIDDTVYIDPYLTRGNLDGIDIGKWKGYIRNDPAYGLLVELDWSAFFIIIMLERGYNDTDVLWRVAELLEDRSISWLEMLWKTDITPKDPDLIVAGWPVGRGLLYQILNVDMVKGIAFGLFFVFFLFWLILRCWKQSLVSALLVLVGMEWMRGTIGLFNIVGLDMAVLGGPIRERVYILSALSVCIVQGVSFSLHKFETYNRTGNWRSAKKVDTLIFNTAAISFFGFITLWSFEVRSIRELGLLSAFAVMYLLMLATVFIPSFGFMKPKRFEGTCAGRYSLSIRKLSYGCAWLARLDPRGYLALTGGLVILALGFICSGKLVVGTRPLEYLPGTMPYRASEYLNQEGRSGFAPLSIYVESAGGDIHDPRFIRAVSDFQWRIRERSRVVFSIVDYAQKLSMKLHGKSLPETREHVEDVFSYLEDGTYPEVRHQLWTNTGVRTLAFVEMDNSIEIGRFNKFVAGLGKEYASLRVYAFGDAALYPGEDKYITEGKPKNAGWSEIVVAVFCMGLIALKSRRLHSRRLSSGIGGFIMSLPFIFASAVTFLLMMALRIPLDVATAMITALAINASIDFSIYYVDAYQEALVRADKDGAIAIAMMDKGEIIINDILLNSVCFFPLIFSRFIPISRLGWMMVVMITACGIGSLVIMPSVLRYAVDRDSKRKEG